MKSIYLLIISLIALPIRSEIGFTQIKGLYDPIPEGKKQCSPVHGFNWWKTGIIENFWTFGDQNSDTIKLIRDLFYLQPDGVTFDVTNLARKPAKYFDAKAIGQIIALIDPYIKPLSDNQTTELKKKLYKELVSLLNFDTLVQTAQQSIAEAKEQKKKLDELRLKKKPQLLNTIATNNIRITQFTKNLETLPENKTTEVRAKIEQTKKELAIASNELKNILQQLGQAKSIERTIHNNALTHENLIALVGYIVGSLQETLQEKYVPYATHQILLAFLWKKVNDKAEFLNYFAAAIPDMNIEDRSKWLQEEYSRQVFSNFQANLDNNVMLVATNYQLNSFVGFGRRMWNTSGLPLLVSSISDAMYQIGDQKYYFPDCGETSLRNFFNIRIYNATTGTLDFSILEAVGILNGFSPKPTVEAYYKKHNNITKIQTKPYYDAWTQVVSGLPGVEYSNAPGYEISPRNGLSNILTVINHLLFNNNDEFNKMTNSKKLDYLVKKLSGPNFTLTWKAKKLPTQNSSQTLNTEDISAPISQAEQVDIDRTNIGLRIIFTINDKIHFSWKFTDNHFVLFAPYTTLTERTGEIGTLIKTINSDATQQLNNINLLCWYTTIQSIPAIKKILSTPPQSPNNEPVWDAEIDDWVTQEESEESQPIAPAIVNDYLILLGMAQDLRDHQIAIPLLNAFMSTPSLTNEHQALIRNLVTALPIKDAHYADQVGWAIAENHVAFLYPLLNGIPIGANTVRAIIQAGNETLYPIAQKNIDDAYEHWADTKSKDSYIALINLPGIKNLPGGEKIVAKFEKLEALKKLEDDIFSAMLTNGADKYTNIIKRLAHITAQPLTAQMDAQLGNILELVLHPTGDEDNPAITEIISLIMKKTKYKPNIAHVAKHTLEDEFDPLYEPLHEAIIANPEFYDLVLEILKNKRYELYKTVKAVVAQTKDKTLLDSIAQSIRSNTITELYPLADTIAPQTKKEEQVVLTLPQLFTSILEFAQGLFSQVVTKFAFKD